LERQRRPIRSAEVDAHVIVDRHAADTLAVDVYTVAALVDRDPLLTVGVQHHVDPRNRLLGGSIDADVTV
jgi:hypothetical protein